jgi:hypothetical protein
LILFFVTTKGPVREKGFLFFSYACIITCSGAIVANVNAYLHSVFMKAAVACIVMALMQVILYGVLLPAFGKVIPYVRTGWGRFYAVVLSFYVLMVAQAVFPILNPMTGKEATFAQRLLVVMLGMPSSHSRYQETARFLRDGWNAWDAWLPSNDYQDRSKFILLPN